MSCALAAMAKRPSQTAIATTVCFTAKVSQEPFYHAPPTAPITLDALRALARSSRVMVLGTEPHRVVWASGQRAQAATLPTVFGLPPINRYSRG